MNLLIKREHFLPPNTQNSLDNLPLNRPNNGKINLLYLEVPNIMMQSQIIDSKNNKLKMLNIVLEKNNHMVVLWSLGKNTLSPIVYQTNGKNDKNDLGPHIVMNEIKQLNQNIVEGINVNPNLFNIETLDSVGLLMQYNESYNTKHHMLDDLNKRLLANQKKLSQYNKKTYNIQTIIDIDEDFVNIINCLEKENNKKKEDHNNLIKEIKEIENEIEKLNNIIIHPITVSSIINRMVSRYKEQDTILYVVLYNDTTNDIIYYNRS